MRLIRAKDYEDMSRKAANIIAAAADIDRRAPGGIGRCRKECETQHKCHQG